MPILKLTDSLHGEANDVSLGVYALHDRFVLGLLHIARSIREDNPEVVCFWIEP